MQDSLEGDLPSVIMEGLPLPLFLLSDNVVGVKAFLSALVDNFHGAVYIYHIIFHLSANKLPPDIFSLTSAILEGSLMQQDDM